jgi:hypothetical protein
MTHKWFDGRQSKATIKLRAITIAPVPVLDDLLYWTSKYDVSSTLDLANCINSPTYRRRIDVAEKKMITIASKWTLSASAPVVVNPLSQIFIIPESRENMNHELSDRSQNKDAVAHRKVAYKEGKAAV